MSTSRRLTLVWVVLLALTVGSVWAANESAVGFNSVVSVFVIGVAMLKARLIGLHFMDLRVAPTALKALFEGYLIVVFAVLVAVDLVVRP